MMEPISMIVFLLLLPLVSFIYSSVGHGGASGYLALMSLFAFSPTMMKQTALLLNLFVAGIAFAQYYKAGHFNFRLFLYFAIGSIPAAFVGGMLTLDILLYKKVLGFLLLFAILRIVWKTEEQKILKTAQPLLALLIGLCIGFFSGLIGIGGGIILTPVILLLHWGKMKEAAAVSALFIWVNSFAGLIGQFSSGVQLTPFALLMVLMAVIGGLLGGYLGSNRWDNTRLSYVLALVLTSAAIKLLLF